LVLAPTSSVVPTADPMFEHRMYVPLFFLVFLFCIGLACVLTWLSRRLPNLPISTTTAFGILVSLAVIALASRTYTRCADYSSLSRIWLSSVRVDPDNDRGVNNLVTAMQEEGRGGQVVDLLATLIRQSESAGKSSEILAMHLAMQWVRQGRAQQAIPVLAQVAAGADPDETRFTYRQRRDASTPWVNLGIAYQQAGRFKEAYEAMIRAIGIDDTAPYSHAIAGHLARQLGRIDEARTHWQRALELRPEPWPELETDLHTLQRDGWGSSATKLPQQP
jgi:tetratricopeptide (TPR) repeat protein